MPDFFVYLQVKMQDNFIHIKKKLDQGLTLKISRFKEQIIRTKPHKHDEYYELIFLSEGEGFHTIEKEISWFRQR
jgi:quercetin dioxygenase-like cupin family protein